MCVIGIAVAVTATSFDPADSADSRAHARRYGSYAGIVAALARAAGSPGPEPSPPAPTGVDHDHQRADAGAQLSERYLRLRGSAIPWRLSLWVRVRRAMPSSLAASA